ncbi:hypothetical protein P280DRAFT_55731 [Massarina eburnea CBS 473.64]|uniref:Uncharacterized protein n=1 Tax=Massarina eburnea CBS 473.64 TaxID=1395130 RepID=A0A6A6RVJ1_9PLEO|nr:hypothetical protein P280DRAFT_55731 [Massarina eburnea CBS 473.64]
MAREAIENEKVQQIVSSTQDEAQQIDQIAKIRNWFKPENGSAYYPAIQSYVQGTTSLNDALKTITTRVDEAISANKLSSMNWPDLWYSIIHTSKRITYHDTSLHTKLVVLVQAIKQLPDPASSDATKPFYSSLPDFSLAAREAYNDSPHYGSGNAASEIFAWANYNYFLAGLTASSVIDRSLYAIWALRAALEDNHDGDVAGYDAYVPAAAVWVFALGKKLYDKEEDLTPSNPNMGNPARGGELWTGGPEFSKKRWAFWGGRFRAVAGLEGVKDETKKVAKEAVEAMEKAEKD